MPSHESMQSIPSMDRSPRETRAARPEREKPAQDIIAPENEGLTPEEIEDQRLMEFVGGFTVDRLRSEQERLEQFIKETQEGMDDIDELSPSTAAMVREMLRDEIRMYEAIRMQRGRLGDRPEIPRAPKLAFEHAPTMFPEQLAEMTKHEARTVPPPRIRKPKDGDFGTRKTELPKSDLPN
jgi:hypothetical protein